MGRLNEAITQQQRGQKDPEEVWDEHDYEKFLKESDARTDKYGELLDKYGSSDEAHEKIAKEMGWTRELPPEEAAEEEKRIAEMNRLCEEALNEPPPEPEPHREGVDWVRDQHGHLHHPLQHRCSERAVKFWKKTDKLGLKDSNDKDLGAFIGEWLTTGAKLVMPRVSFGSALVFKTMFGVVCAEFFSAARLMGTPKRCVRSDAEMVSRTGKICFVFITNPMLVSPV